MAKTGRFKGYFVRGLTVLLPTVLTIWLILWAFNFINNTISVHIKNGIVFLIKLAGGSKEELSTFWVNAGLSVAGFLIAIGLVYVVGVILGSIFGRAIWTQVEHFIMNMPLLKQLYPYIKQITDFFLSKEKTKKMFSRVVGVEFPRKGVWSVGLVTGEGLKKITDKEAKKFLTVVIATTPSPLTGFLVVVPADEVIDLDMTIEDAFGFIVSAGLVTPSGEKGGPSPAVISQDDINRLQGA